MEDGWFFVSCPNRHVGPPGNRILRIWKLVRSGLDPCAGLNISASAAYVQLIFSFYMSFRTLENVDEVMSKNRCFVIIPTNKIRSKWKVAQFIYIIELLKYVALRPLQKRSSKKFKSLNPIVSRHFCPGKMCLVEMGAPLVRPCSSIDGCFFPFFSFEWTVSV